MPGISEVRAEASSVSVPALVWLVSPLPGQGVCGTPGMPANPGGPGTSQGNTGLSTSSRHTQASGTAPAPALLGMREKNTKNKLVPNLSNSNKKKRVLRTVGLSHSSLQHLRSLHRPTLTSEDVSCWPSPRISLPFRLEAVAPSCGVRCPLPSRALPGVAFVREGGKPRKTTTHIPFGCGVAPSTGFRSRLLSKCSFG